MNNTTVELGRLKAVVCRLIDELAAEIGSSSFELPEDGFYWKIPPDAKMVETGNPGPPQEYWVGRLRDDWELTCWIADGPTDQKISAYSLTEVASLFDYMGESVARKS